MVPRQDAASGRPRKGLSLIHISKGENIVRFNKKLIDATKAVAGCYKVQIAYYESLGLEGLKRCV